MFLAIAALALWFTIWFVEYFKSASTNKESIVSIIGWAVCAYISSSVVAISLMRFFIKRPLKPYRGTYGLVYGLTLGLVAGVAFFFLELVFQNALVETFDITFAIQLGLIFGFVWFGLICGILGELD